MTILLYLDVTKINLLWDVRLRSSLAPDVRPVPSLPHPVHGHRQARDPRHRQPLHTPDHRGQRHASHISQDWASPQQESCRRLLSPDRSVRILSECQENSSFSDEKLLEKLSDIYKFDFILFGFDNKNMWIDIVLTCKASLMVFHTASLHWSSDFPDFLNLTERAGGMKKVFYTGTKSLN